MAIYRAKALEVDEVGAQLIVVDVLQKTFSVGFAPKCHLPRLQECYHLLRAHARLPHDQPPKTKEPAGIGLPRFSVVSPSGCC